MKVGPDGAAGGAHRANRIARAKHIALRHADGAQAADPARQTTTVVEPEALDFCKRGPRC